MGKGSPDWRSAICLNSPTRLFEVGGGNFGIGLDAGSLFIFVQDMLEVFGVGIQHDFAEHLDEAAIGVIGEAFVTGQRDQALHGLVVDTEVQHGIHHAGHGELGA